MFTYTQTEIDNLNSKHFLLNVEMSDKMIDFLIKGDFQNATLCLQKGALPLYHNPRVEEENMNVLHALCYLYWNFPKLSSWVEYNKDDDYEENKRYTSQDIKMFSDFENFIRTWKSYGGNFNSPVKIPDPKILKDIPTGQYLLSDFYYNIIFQSFYQNKQVENPSFQFYALNETLIYMEKIIQTGEFDKLEPAFFNSNVLGIWLREAWPYGNDTFINQLNINQNNFVDSQGNTPLHYFYNSKTMNIPEFEKNNETNESSIHSFIQRYTNNIEQYFDVKNVLHIKNLAGLTPVEAALKEKSWHCLVGLISLSEKYTPQYSFSDTFIHDLNKTVIELENKNHNDSNSVFVELLRQKKTNIEKLIISNSLENKHTASLSINRL